MDTMFQFGRKVAFTKAQLDAKLGSHDESYYDEERFIRMGEERYALRGRAKSEEAAWEYSELLEVTRDQVTAYHVTTDYREVLDADLEAARQLAEQEKGRGTGSGSKE